ncbi:MAG: hypothetical protein OHK0024_21110 [Thalassobaculales bacterium]
MAGDADLAQLRLELFRRACTETATLSEALDLARAAWAFATGDLPPSAVTPSAVTPSAVTPPPAKPAAPPAPPPATRRRRFSDGEIAQLRLRLAAGDSVPIIAAALGRREQSVHSLIARLHLRAPAAAARAKAPAPVPRRHGVYKDASPAAAGGG